MANRYSKEQVIAQHEKNTQDWNYHVIQSIENLKRQIEEVKNAVSDLYAKQSSIVADIIAKTDAFEKRISVHFRNVNQVVDTVVENFKTQKQDLNVQLGNVKSLYMDKQSCKSALQEQDKAISHMSTVLIAEASRHRDRTDKILRDFSGDLDNHRKDIATQIQQLPDIKPELLEKIAIAQVDKDGVLRELRILKREVFIQSKYIEKLSTDLENITTKAQQ